MRGNPKVARRRAVAAVVALAFVAVACGDDDDDGDDSSDVTAAAAASTAASEDTAATEGTEPTASAPEGTEPTDTEGSATTQASDDAAADVDREASLTYAYSTGHTSFDPHTTPSSADQMYMRQVYDTLLTLGRDDAGTVVLVPRLATSYEFAEDGLSIEFTLRDDVTFQDGTPFNAEAVKANIERALGEGSTVASLISAVTAAEVVDEHTVVLRLSRPDASVPWSLATNTTGMMVSPAAFGTDLSTTPVGSGPFQLVSAQRDAEVVFERWDDHWDPDAALVREFTILTIPDGNARYNGVQSGDYDLAFLAAPLDAESQSLEGEGYHWNQAVSPVTVGVGMHTEKAPFDDVRVRQAVSMAVNRTEMSEALLNGINPPAYQPITEGYFGHNPDLDVDPYDPEAARTLIQEAGAEGAAVEIIQPTTAPQDQIALVVQEALNEIGLQVQLLPISPTDARTVWREGNHQAIVYPIIAQIEPSQTLAISFLSTDNPATPPAELVEMSEAAAATLPFGGPEQEEAYQEISAYLVENPIQVPYVNFSTVILARPEIVGSEKTIVTGVADFDIRGVGKSAS